MSSDDSTPEPRFDGWDSPNYTEVPNQFFDEVMVKLKPAELRIMLYLMRRTFGFQKRADTISLDQFVKGFKTRDGTVQDLGAGVSRPAAIEALRSLAAKGYIEIVKNTDARGADLATTYRMRFKTTARTGKRELENFTPGSSAPGQGGKVYPLQGGNKLAPQKKEQNKVQKIEGSPPTSKEKRPPLTPSQLHRLHPAQDRDLILAGKVEPFPPPKSSMGEIMAWDGLRQDWRKRHGK